MQEIALISRKIYTAGTNFTRPPVVTVATNLNSVCSIFSRGQNYQNLVIVLKIIIHPVILLDYQKHDKSFSQGSTWTTTSGGKAERFHRESSFAIWFKFWILNLILHQFYNNVSQVLQVVDFDANSTSYLSYCWCQIRLGAGVPLHRNQRARLSRQRMLSSE